MAELRFPTMLAPLFVGFERRVDVDATTVGEALDRLDEKWPGLRDRLCESATGLPPVCRAYAHTQAL